VGSIIFIGIDVGLTGAVAAIPDHTGWPVKIHDTPTLMIASGRKNKRDYMIPEMVRILNSYYDPNCNVYAHVVIESVHAMPKQGVSSTFSFGRGLGIWEGVLSALGIPYEFVTPQRWKKEMMGGMGKDKSASRLRAMQLFPQLSDQLNLKKHDGRAEALLLAELCRRTHETIQ